MASRSRVRELRAALQSDNGCSDLILAAYGVKAGAHSRSAIGAANLPLDNPVIIEAEIEID
jgi:hypothetical protein